MLPPYSVEPPIIMYLGLSISRDGKVKAIHVSAGDKVADEDIILELE